MKVLKVQQRCVFVYRRCLHLVAAECPLQQPKLFQVRGGRIESNMRMLMLSIQMQQIAQQISMQQQIFLQQMQMHMSAMEKHADTSKKYLWRIAKSMTTHNNKCKRGGTDEEDNDKLK